MISNKKGLSAIIVTLILVLLSIVVATIVWVVINNIVQGESGKIDTQTRCFEISVKAEKVNETSPGTYDVTLTRTAGGDSIDGVKIIFTNETGGSSYVHTAAGNIAPLATTTVNASSVTITNANKVEIFPYFLSDSGGEDVCSASTEFEFTLG